MLEVSHPGLDGHTVEIEVSDPTTPIIHCRCSCGEIMDVVKDEPIDVGAAFLASVTAQEHFEAAVAEHSRLN